MWIEKLANGKYKYSERYKKDGKWLKVSITHTKENKRVEKEMFLKLQEKIDEKLEEKNNTDVTFDLLIDEWLRVYEVQAKPTSYNNFNNMAAMLNRQFGSKLVTDLKSGGFNNFIFEKTSQTSYATGKAYINLIKRLLKFAVQQDYLSHDPISDKLMLPKINVNQKDDFKYLEIDELEIVLNHLKGDYERAAKIIVNTGLRIGELAAIKFDDINLDDNSININETYNPNLKTFSSPKSGKSRTIYFNDNIKHTIKEQIKATKVKQLRLNYRNDYLFMTHYGNPLNAHSFNLKLKKIQLPSGKNVTTHYFRHTYITMMLQKGVERRFIAEQVGHADTKMIDGIYSHFTQTMQEKQKEMQLKHSII